MKEAIAISVLLLAAFGWTTHRLWSNPHAMPDSEWIGKQAPELADGSWINSPGLSLKALRGKVVVLEFWTFGCYNCRNTLPYVKGWYTKYAGPQFEMVGVHTPEFDREKDLSNVRREVARLGISYPVVTDNDYRTWDRYHQRYWPVIYVVDKRGVIRYLHIGEGDYDETDREIASLIAED
jgi:thiol-disulfide isomerase/thioredoxin